jgi:hypothetical protein
VRYARNVQTDLLGGGRRGRGQRNCLSRHLGNMIQTRCGAFRPLPDGRILHCWSKTGQKHVRIYNI